jgi:hypothetical protein
MCRRLDLRVYLVHCGIIRGRENYSMVPKINVAKVSAVTQRRLPMQMPLTDYPK